MTDPQPALDDLLSRLGPEGLQRLLEMGSQDEQQGQLEKQMQYAQALGQPGPQQHGWAGQALQGAANMWNTYTSLRKQKELQSDQDRILGDKTKARRGVANAYFGLPADDMFGLGHIPGGYTPGQ